jgi:tetratricopeptide (TPR) repeat protein
MKTVCPLCKTAVDVPEKAAGVPATQTICHQCGAELAIEHKTGKIQVVNDKHAKALGEKASGRRPKYEMTPVLSTKPREKGRRDYLAIGIFALVLSALIAIGIYFSLNISRGVLDKPLDMISEMIDEAVDYGKSVWDQIKKDRQPKGKQDRRHLSKGYDYYKENRLKEALAKLSQAVESNPQNYEAYYWRARTYIRMGQFDNAIADLNQVVDINPRYRPAYDNLGWLFMRRNKWDESLMHLGKSIELKPDNGWAHYMRGRVFFNKGDLQKAYENAAAACKLGYKDGCRDAKRYQSKLTENS